MSQGDFTLFTAAKAKLMDGTFDINTDMWKLALITGDEFTPAASTVEPCWGTNGSPNTATDLSQYEVVGGSPQGTYTAGGKALTTVTWTESGGTVTFDADPVTFAQDAANPTDARWGILYSDSATNKDCLGFLDLGGTTDLSAGGFSATPSATGILTLA